MLVFMSADLSVSPKDMLFFNHKIHADLSVRLFPRAITSEVPPPKV